MKKGIELVRHLIIVICFAYVNDRLYATLLYICSLLNTCASSRVY